MSAAGSENRSERLRRGVVVAVAALSLAVGLGACDSVSDPAPGATSTPSPSAELAVAGAHTDVDYYGACGNEVLTLPDATFYPLHDEEREALDRGAYLVLLPPAPRTLPPPSPSAALDGGAALAAFPMVPAPGPGDDTGTLTIFSDGIARFVSDSGNEIWLTNEFRDYDWIC